MAEERVRLLKWGIVGLIVVVILATTIPFILGLISERATQPNIILTDKELDSRSCYRSGRLYKSHFTLTNTGDAHGLAEIHLYIDEEVVMQEAFVVLMDESIERSMEVVVDCLDHSMDVRVGNVTKV